LKHQAGHNILVAGSSTLVQTLMQNELVDDFHLIVCPIVLGSGKHLFKDGSNAALNLADVTRFRSGAVLLVYKKVT